MAHFCAAATEPSGRSAWSIIPPPLTVGLDGSRGPVLTGGHVDLEDLFQRRNGKDSVARLLGIFTASGAFDDRSRPLPRLTGQTRTFA